MSECMTCCSKPCECPGSPRAERRTGVFAGMDMQQREHEARVIALNAVIRDLEVRCAELETKLDIAVFRIRRSLGRAKVLEEALRWYADEGNYPRESRTMTAPARQALQAVPRETEGYDETTKGRLGE